MYLENFRYYAEECDTVGTVQILTDVHNGFGGLSCSFLEMLQDEMLSSAVTVVCNGILFALRMYGV